MLPYHPDSTSELLRARHIVVAVLESAVMSDWLEEEDEPLAERDVRAVIRIEGVLKGELPVPADSRVEITFQIFELRGPRYVALPGIWSKQTLSPGGRYVIFSAGRSDQAAEALSEPPAFRVEAAAASLPEIEAVIAAATPGKSLPAFLGEVAGGRASFSHLIARYVAARIRELLFNDVRGFNAVLREAEHPEASRIFRRTVLIEAYDDLIMLAPAPAVFVARLIWGSVRAVASGPAADMASRVLEVYIPNLVGLKGGLAPRAAADVFEGAPLPRKEVAETLRGRPDLPGCDRVLRWVEL